VPNVRVDGFGAGYVRDAKSTKGTTNPNTRRPLKDGYYDHGQNCVKDIALMFGSGARRKPVLKEKRSHPYTLDSLSWIKN